MLKSTHAVPPPEECERIFFTPTASAFCCLRCGRVARASARRSTPLRSAARTTPVVPHAVSRCSSSQRAIAETAAPRPAWLHPHEAATQCPQTVTEGASQVSARADRWRCGASIPCAAKHPPTTEHTLSGSARAMSLPFCSRPVPILWPPLLTQPNQFSLSSLDFFEMPDMRAGEQRDTDSLA